MDEIYLIWQDTDKAVIGATFNEKLAYGFAKAHDGYVFSAPVITDECYNEDMIREWVFQIENGIIVCTDKEYVDPQDRQDEVKESVKWATGKATVCYGVRVYDVEDEKTAMKMAFDKLARFKAENKRI